MSHFQKSILEGNSKLKFDRQADLGNNIDLEYVTKSSSWPLESMKKEPIFMIWNITELKKWLLCIFGAEI